MKWNNLSEEMLTEAKVAKNEAEAKAWLHHVGAATEELEIHPDGSISCHRIVIHGDNSVRRLGVKILGARVVEIYHCNLDDLRGLPDVSVTHLLVAGKIKSLDGCPREIHEFTLRATSLRDLTGGPDRIDGRMTLENNRDLESMAGGPKHVYGELRIANCSRLKSFVGFPEEIELLDLEESKGFNESLKGINRIKKMKTLIMPAVSQDIVGLTQIEGLHDIRFGRYVRPSKELEDALRIVKKYGGGRDMQKARECQKELMDADLDDFAG